MNTIAKFKPLDKSIFYIDYLLSKTLYIWRLAKKDRLKLFIYENLYMIGKVVRRPLHKIYSPQINQIFTIDGKFNIRDRTNDLTCASPTFERRDKIEVNHVIINENLDTNDTAFLDIGADIGLYTIFVGNFTNKLHIYSFEPNPETFEILNENIALNNLGKRVTTMNVGLGAIRFKKVLVFDKENPGSGSLVDNHFNRHDVTESIINIERLDGINALNSFRNLIIKLDVEGYETFVMRGGKKLFEKANIYLLVEDFVENQILDYLKDNGFVFVKKLTPYNSWWVRLADKI